MGSTTVSPSFVAARAAERFVVTGVVQGVGFRPFIYRLANEFGLQGEVGNSASDVFITVAGDPHALDQFALRLRSDAPPLARIDQIHRDSAVDLGFDTFSIVESAASEGPRTLVAPDSAVCHDCVGEMTDPSDRRFGHPFITCTNCGPRFTIINDLPYDRPATSMSAFEMCATCRSEYSDPTDRRYHAQPIACHDCGPELRVTSPGGDAICGDPLATVVAAVRQGGVVAVKGIGGFHLLCDAQDPEAIAELRRRKQRPDKPFAVMAADMATIRSIAILSVDEADQLLSPARPIVLAPKQAGGPVLGDQVAPGNPLVGVMLPYTPIHHLLFTAGLGP